MSFPSDPPRGNYRLASFTNLIDLSSTSSTFDSIRILLESYRRKGHGECKILPVGLKDLYLIFNVTVSDLYLRAAMPAIVGSLDHPEAEVANFLSALPDAHSIKKVFTSQCPLGINGGLNAPIFQSTQWKEVEKGWSESRKHPVSQCLASKLELVLLNPETCQRESRRDQRSDEQCLLRSCLD